MPAQTHKIRVMIVDDHGILRSGLKMLLNAQVGYGSCLRSSRWRESGASGTGNETRCGLAGPYHAKGWGYEGAAGDGADLPRDPGARTHDAR